VPAFHICVQANYNTANKARDISLATTYFLATSLFAIIIPTIQYAEQSSFMHEAILRADFMNLEQSQKEEEQY